MYNMMQFPGTLKIFNVKDIYIKREDSSRCYESLTIFLVLIFFDSRKKW